MRVCTSQSHSKLGDDDSTYTYFNRVTTHSSAGDIAHLTGLADMREHGDEGVHGGELVQQGRGLRLQRGVGGLVLTVSQLVQQHRAPGRLHEAMEGRHAAQHHVQAQQTLLQHLRLVRQRLNNNGHALPNRR